MLGDGRRTESCRNWLARMRPVAVEKLGEGEVEREGGRREQEREGGREEGEGRREGREGVWDEGKERMLISERGGGRGG